MSHEVQTYLVTLPDSSSEQSGPALFDAAVTFFKKCGIDISSERALQGRLFGMFLVTLRSEIADTVQNSPGYRCLENAVAQGIIRDFKYDQPANGVFFEE